MPFHLFYYTRRDTQAQTSIRSRHDHLGKSALSTLDQFLSQQRKNYGSVQPDCAMRKHFGHSSLYIRRPSKECKQSVCVRLCTQVILYN